MIRDWFLSRLVVRTTFLVLGATLAVGLLADQTALRVMRNRAEAQQREAMEALLDVVEPTASAACFVGDQVLAQQVVQGLVGTPSVETAVIRSGTTELARSVRKGRGHGAAPIVRPVYSPFVAGSQIGELMLVPDTGEAARQVSRTLALVRTVIASLSLALGLTLAQVVHRGITRPIGLLSARLHALEATSGARLLSPAGHEGDEIGQLVRDVNALVERLMEVLWSERHLRSRIERDQHKLQAILENAGTGIFVLHRNGALDAWTPAFLRYLGLEQAPPPQGTSFPVLFGLEAAQAEALLERCQQEGTQVTGTLMLQDFHGERLRCLQLTLDPIGQDWIQGVLGDVTTHVEAQEAAQERAIRDPLTGALNRLGVEHLLQDRSGSMHGFMLVDLDLFKAVNDTLGHEAGDQVLRQTVQRMKGSLRRTDEVARIGGDEFLLILDNLLEGPPALALGEKVIRAVSAPVLLPEGREARIGASIGIAFWHPEGGESWEEALKRADAAMYQCKQAGRNQVRLAEEEPPEDLPVA